MSQSRSNVALLNPQNADHACSLAIETDMAMQLASYENSLTTMRQDSHADYLSLFAKATALREALNRVRAIIGNTFRV